VALPNELQARVTTSTARIVDCGVGATDEIAHGAVSIQTRVDYINMYCGDQGVLAGLAWSHQQGADLPGCDGLKRCRL
jgi:hypothetical protein